MDLLHHCSAAHLRHSLSTGIGHSRGMVLSVPLRDNFFRIS